MADGRRPLVLVADDDIGHRAMMRLALEAFGFEIVEVDNGRQVLDGFAERRPDIILLDVLMPGANGYDVCRRVRDFPMGKHCPIVMVTGLDDTNSINRAYESGATDFITKPINWPILGHRVRYILRASQAESEVAKAHTLLMDAIESFPAAFQLYDDQERLVICNSRAHEDDPLAAERFAVGAKRAEILRALAESGAVVEAKGRVEGWVAEMLARSHDPDLTLSAVDQERSDGRWLKIIQRRTSSGGLVSLGIDITELKQRERALSVAKTNAESANRAKSEFLANVSHELRTPLNAVIGFSEAMKCEIYGPLGTERYRQYVTDIHESGQHLLSLISDILDMSRIEAGKLELREERVSTADLIGSCIRLMHTGAERASLRLVADIPQRAPELYGDTRMIRQMLFNLLSNAIKFTPPGGCVRVSLGPTPAGDFAIRVEDTGIGIANTDLDKVLSPFGQIESVYARKHQGTGLGLTLTKAMIESHGGSLELRSVLGEGSIVELIFPGHRLIKLSASAA